MTRLLIAGGGTGGHLFPGIAVAEEFMRGDPKTEVLFVGTGRPVEAEVLGARGLSAVRITAAGFKGKGIRGRIRSLASVPVGLFQSMGIIKRFNPSMVFGVGGYSSGPVGLAARLMGRPTAIHEQNSVPGMTNRILGRLVDLVFISFESSRSFFPQDKVRLTGNPIRAEIAAAADVERPVRSEGSLTLLVVGGSQGARAVNRAAVGAVSLLVSRFPGLRLIHQTGEPDYEEVRSAYERIGLRAEVAPFIQDMGRVYQAADLVLGRAGALTVAEVAAMGLPAVFVPLPTAASNHQEINARSLADVGAARIILQRDLTADTLAGVLAELMNDLSGLVDMAKAARNTARPAAAREIRDHCLTFLEAAA
ncbi:MAG: undecaprenyldiphospho-muramoylpentapeptide beta-N-acetylglucosaminyltransferase [Proteobacteria bacterium]|nr:undecaprenyldiphospho-muramoylpentapeptide beta-N-acetylglucosaminyltransferase [Pseudomonadota bacterium]